MARVLVAGGGIAGLSAAREICTEAEVVLVERDAHLGGKIETATFRERRVDLGPDAFITRDRAAIELCEALALGDELVFPAARTAAVFANGALHRLPTGLVVGIPTDLRALARSGLVSRAAVARARVDRVFPSRMAVSRRDQTVAEIVRPRLGDAVVSRLVDPLIGGINASDVETLSFAAALSQLLPAIERRRSLTRALAPLARRGPGDAPVFSSLRSGLGTLVERLAEDCERHGVALRTRTALTRIDTTAHGRWRAELAEGEEEFDAVVLALPARDAARVVTTCAPELAAELSTIAYASVATVTLAYCSDAVPQDLPLALGGARGDGLVGSGVLVARSPARTVTAATFTSTKWPHAAREGEVVVRCSLGRHRDERALIDSDEVLAGAVRAELASMLGVTAEPLEVAVRRFPESFPQYVSGHLARVERIEALAGATAGLALCGAAYRGIGIPACIRSGVRAANAVRARL